MRPRVLNRARGPAVLLVAILVLGAGAGPSAGSAEESAGASPEAAARHFAEASAEFDRARSYAADHPTDRDESERRYRRAAEGFISAWKAGAASTEVFTNAANSFHFAGDVGEAVLFYRRALAVDPSNRRAKQGLDHIRSTLPIRKEAGGAGASIVRSLFFWHEGMGFRARRNAFIALQLGAFTLLAASLWRRRPFRFLGSMVLLAALLLLGSLAADGLGGSLRNDVVILVEVEGREGDGSMYTRSHSKPFPPGTEASVLAERPGAPGPDGRPDPWLLVRLADGSESFIPSRTAARVIE